MVTDLQWCVRLCLIGMKHREDRVVGGEVKPAAPLFGQEEEEEEPEVLYDKGFTHQQLAMVESSAVMIEEREREIQSIVQSISEINEMYRDLATMIVDQVLCCVLEDSSLSPLSPSLSLFLSPTSLCLSEFCTVAVHASCS